MTALIGFEIDNRRAAFCVAVAEWRDEDAPHFVVRFLDRLPPRTPFPKIAQRWAEILDRLQGKVERPSTFVNITNVGMPVFKLIRQAADGWLEPVQFVHGHQEPEEKDEILTLGKAFVVRRLQVLLETNRLHLPETRDSHILAEELANADIEIPKGESGQPGAFKVGTRDELVMALGLAVSRDTARPRTGEPEPLFLGPANPVTDILNRLRNAHY